MKKIIPFILLFSIFVSCQETKKNNTKQDIKTDFSTIELKVERGAFHYDTFILKDTTITFYPESKIDSIENSEHQKYYKTSVNIISNSERNTLIQHLLDADIWNLKEKYTPEGSCTSNVVVTIRLNGKTERIQCDDFVRGCPNIIKFIEKEMVRLHGKGLKRIFLPG